MTRSVMLLASGKVQGVFYRQSLKVEAHKLGVFGWVRNLPDGNVEALLEGEDDSVNKLIEWARRGPAGSRVDSVKISECKPSGAQTFEVRY